MDEQPMARFGRIEEAVEAVDFELERMGRAAALSAKHDAGWRRAGDRGDALRLAVWRRFHPATWPCIARGQLLLGSASAEDSLWWKRVSVGPHERKLWLPCGCRTVVPRDEDIDGRHDEEG